MKRATSRRRRALLPALILLSGGCFWSTGSFTDDFSHRGGRCVPDGGRLGRWTVESTGFGCVKQAGGSRDRWLEVDPLPSERPGSTHSALVTGPSFKAPFFFSVRVATVKQLRSGSPPNGWETAWVVWGYRDRKHFYYFIPKPGGWELGKRDPAFPGGQRYLENGSSPTFPLGAWADITITQDSTNLISVSAGGRPVTAFRDEQRPYAAGKIGLYGEDCLARFKNVSAAVY